MLRNILFAGAAIVAPIAMTTDAMAGSSTETGKQHACWGAYSAPRHHHQHAAYRTFTHGLSRDAGTYYSVLPEVSAFRGQGYVYVPRKGILGEACNLPTSACPNERRDVQ